MYLVVIYGSWETDSYYFETKQEMLKFFEIKNIKELIKTFNSRFSRCVVYKIAKKWEEVN